MKIELKDFGYPIDIEDKMQKRFMKWFNKFKGDQIAIAEDYPLMLVSFVSLYNEGIKKPLYESVKTRMDIIEAHIRRMETMRSQMKANEGVINNTNIESIISEKRDANKSLAAEIQSWRFDILKLIKGER